MFRMWGKLIRDNHLLKDYIVEPGLDTASGITGAWLLARNAEAEA